MPFLLFRGKKPIRKLLSLQGTSYKCEKYPQVREGAATTSKVWGPAVDTMNPVLTAEELRLFI